jgi:hypothetical protein
MAISCRPVDGLEDFHARRLETLENMSLSIHRRIAVAAALDYCARHGLNAPPWLVTAAAEVLREVLRRERSTKRGRSCGSVARYRQDQIDFERWDVVQYVRQNQKKTVEDIKELSSMKRPSKDLLTERQRMLHWAGRTWLRTFECASMILKGRQAHAGPDAVRTSYKTVERSIRNEDWSVRYHMLDQEFLRWFGFEGPLDRKQGTKIVPLYDLTL